MWVLKADFLLFVVFSSLSFTSVAPFADPCDSLGAECGLKVDASASLNRVGLIPQIAPG